MKISTMLKHVFFLLTFCLVYHSIKAEDKKVVRVGGIFHESNYDVEIAFRYAINRVNIFNQDFVIEPVIRTVASIDSFKAGSTVCELTTDGVAAIFGPESFDTRAIVESTCHNLEIPHIQFSWDPEPNIRPNDMSINFYPEQEAYSEAIAALVNDYDWNSFTILYEDEDGLIRLQEVLKQHKEKDHVIVLRQLDIGGDNRPLLKEVRSSQEVHIILDCAAERIVEYLRQANEVKLMEDYQSYILTSLDAHTVDLAELRLVSSNITGLRMLEPSDRELRDTVRIWEQGEKNNRRPLDIQPETIRLEVALINDAVNHFAKAFADLHKDQDIETMSVPCNQTNTWSHGLGLVHYMKAIPTEGLTGMIMFDESNGRRKQCVLDITELSKAGFKKIGLWDTIRGINYTRSSSEAADILAEKWQNKTFIVTSRLGPPFLFEKKPKDGEVLSGNHRYEGYSMDLIDGIAKILNFSYEFQLVPDGNYGSFDKDTKKWNGLVKELLDRKADLAICDLTITYERRAAVDFTMPFMTLGISILFAKADKKDPDLFSFLSPLSVEVWIYMATAYLGISILLFILGRMSPKEWSNPHPCDDNNPELENILTLTNSTWLMMGSILQQGSDIMPKATSTRMVAGMWWFFTLIMISSYTANLAAFLTNERMDATVSNAEDLAKQSKIKYGSLEKGSTSSFFKNSNFSTYKRMWASMESTRPSVFVKSNEEGRERVLKGKRLYAFLMESTSIEYIVERYCELQQIGGLLDSKGYGIAMPMNSPYRTAISGAVLRMQEEGKLQLFKTKWWKEMHGGGGCTDEESEDDASAMELGIENVGGVFVVLGCGCGIAFSIAIMEFLWNVRQVAVDEKVTFGEAFKAEIKFALNIWETTKPIHTPSTESSSSSSGDREGRGVSEARSIAANVLHTASSFMRLDKIF